MLRKVLFGPGAALRNGWWILVFYLLLGGAVVGMVQLAPEGRVPVAWQLAAVVLVTATLQAIRRRSLFEVTGAPNLAWWRNLAAGAAIGMALWGVTTVMLVACGASAVTLSGDGLAFLSGLAGLVGAAVLEELLFRGFVFQRLHDGLGPVLALVLSSLHFTLVHVDNPDLGVIAMLNIFIASVAFGLAYLKTGSLALPIGIHVFANIMQGPVLGFGVSGHAMPHLFSQQLSGPDWLTGGGFGLEASVPGTLAIAFTAWWLWRHPGQKV